MRDKISSLSADDFVACDVNTRILNHITEGRMCHQYLF